MARWVYKVKPRLLDQTPKYKARLVVQGFEQQHDVDYHDKFALIVKWETIRIIARLAAHTNSSIMQMDVQRPS